MLLSLDALFWYVYTGLGSLSMIYRMGRQSFGLIHLFSFFLFFSSTHSWIFISRNLLTFILVKNEANIQLQLPTQKMNQQEAKDNSVDIEPTPQSNFQQDQVFGSEDEDVYSEDSVQDQDSHDMLMQNYEVSKEQQNYNGGNCQSKVATMMKRLDCPVSQKIQKLQNFQQEKVTFDANQTMIDQNAKKRRGTFPRGEIKSKSFTYDSKIIHAAYELLKPQLKLLMNSDDGFIKVNPYQDSKRITIFYYDEQKLKEAKNKLDECIMQIEVVPINKIIATSGLQLSLKLEQKMKKRKMSYFNDITQKYKTPSYYLCGRVQLDDLQKMLDEIRQIKFTYISLFKYQLTRSYKAIVSRIFSLPTTQQFITQKLQAKQIQVACLKRNFTLPEERNPFVLITFPHSRKILNHQEIEAQIYQYIKQTYAVFCFCFNRKSGSSIPRFIPKVENVEWFFISERKLKTPISYLYIIVKREAWIGVKQAIIDGIKNMNLDIVSRRFFKNLHPTKEEVIQIQKFHISYYPKNHPYSWVYSAVKGQKFDWTAQLQL